MGSIGERLREERERLGYNQTDFGAFGGVGKKAQSNYEGNGRSPDADYLAGIAKAGADIAYIITGVRSKTENVFRMEKPGLIGESHDMEGFTLVPRYDIKGGMGGGQIVHSEQVVDHLAFRTEWVRSELRANPSNLALISAVGDSMEPTLSSGDLLLLDKSEYKVRDDAIYVISVNGALLVKRVQLLLDGTVVIRSDNPAYQPQIVKQPDIEQLKIVGRVVWIGRRV